MIKKILIGLGVISLIVLPFFALAQFPAARMSNCCNLKHAVSPYPTDECVCEPNPTNPAQCSESNTCISKGVTIPAANCAGANYAPDPDWGGYCTMDTVYTATDAIFWFFIAFVVIMGIYTGVTFMTAGGDPGKIEKARSMLMYLVIGIIVAVAVKLIPSLARAIIGV